MTTEGGAALLKMMALLAGMAQGANLKGKLPLPEFADIAGDWDEARIIGCCNLNARPKERPVCSLLTRAEVEALLGPLTAEPTGSDQDCTWRYQRKGIDGKLRDWPMVVKLSWRGGFADLRDSVQLAGKVMSSLMSGGASGGEAAAPESAKIEGPWDEAASTVDFMAVRKDVIVRIDLRIADEATAQKFAGALLQKL